MAKQTIPTSKHDQANAAYLKGNYKEAIELQVEVVNNHIKNGKAAITARKLLALYLYSSQEYDAAITLLKTLAVELPDDSEIPENIGVMLRQAGDQVEAVKYLLKAHEMSPEKFNICDGLAHCFHSLKDPEQVQKFGRMSLELKDAAANGAKAWPVPDGPPPAFNSANRERNIISFSLFGDKPRYLHGALRNAKLAADLYPGWSCRFYCDPEVPKSVLKELKELDCQIKMRPAMKNFYEGLLWRFEVIDDPSVDRFLVRDCDSVINIKERVAVDEWIKSDKWFHLMRDFPSHTEMILAGMWGGISGVFPPLAELDEAFNPQTAATRTYDQHLLREMVWPTIRQSVMIHDSVYTGCLGSVPFSDLGQLPADRHIGQNEAAIIDEKKLTAFAKDAPEEVDRFFVVSLPGSGVGYLQQLLDAHGNVYCPPEHHLSTLWKNSRETVLKYQEVVSKIDRKAANQGHSLNTGNIKRDLYKTWLEHLFVDYVNDGVSHVGINDNGLDKNLPYHSKMFPEAKFLFLARDPRDVAVKLWAFKKENDPGFDRDGTQLTVIASKIGKEWSEKLRNVQNFNQACPGKIELVRYEDLASPDTQVASFRRILNFLSLPSSDSLIESIFETVFSDEDGECVWEDALSMAHIGAIQRDAGKLMRLLQYKECEINHREIEAGDTILPS